MYCPNDCIFNPNLFDDVVDLCKNHDEMLKCIPAIQPISNKDLRQTASGYGTYRSDLWNDEVSFRYGLFGLIRGQMYMLPEMELS